MIAVAFALPEESRDFVAFLHAPERLGPRECPLLCGRLHGRKVAVFHTGLGEAWARARLRRLAESGAADGFDRLIAAGFAGGLDPSLPAGHLVLTGSDPAQVSQAEAILGGRACTGRLATSPVVLETPRAKAAFARETGALAVEMETAAVKKFAIKRGIPLLALRAITDPADEALPIPTDIWFDTAAQRPRPLALLGYLLARPGKWGAFVRFLRNVRRARRALTTGLLDLVEGL